MKWTTHCPVQRHYEWTSDSNHCSQSGSRTWGRGILHYCGPQKKHRKSAGNLGILGKTILELRFDLFLGRFNININVHVCVYIYIYTYNMYLHMYITFSIFQLEKVHVLPSSVSCEDALSMGLGKDWVAKRGRVLWGFP